MHGLQSMDPYAICVMFYAALCILYSITYDVVLVLDIVLCTTIYSTIVLCHCILMASDFQDPIELIPKYVEEWKKSF